MCDHECHYADLQKRESNDIRAEAQKSGRFFFYLTRGSAVASSRGVKFVAFKTPQGSQATRFLPLLKVCGLRWVTSHHPASVSSTF